MVNHDRLHIGMVLDDDDEEVDNDDSCSTTMKVLKIIMTIIMK